MWIAFVLLEHKKSNAKNVHLSNFLEFYTVLVSHSNDANKKYQTAHKIAGLNNKRKNKKTPEPNLFRNLINSITIKISSAIYAKTPNRVIMMFIFGYSVKDCI